MNYLGLPLPYELSWICSSDSLSEDGLREIIERFGCEPNNNLQIEKYNFFFSACGNERATPGILRYLLEYFPNAANAISLGFTPVQSILQGHYKNATRGLVQVLIDAYPESLRRGDDDGCTPLHILCKSSSLVDDSAAVDILDLFLERCPEAARQFNNTGELPIQIAVTSKSPEFCRMLIEAYPESERITDSYGMLLIHNTCLHGTVATAKYLYKLYPESINVTDSYGRYPIHCVFQDMWTTRSTPATAIEMVRFFLNCDKNVASQKVRGELPLCYLCTGSAFELDSSNMSKLSAAMEILQLLYDTHPEAIEEDVLAIHLHMFPEEVQTFIITQRAYARQARDLTFMMTSDENGQVPLHIALRDNVALGSIKLLVKGNPAAIQTPDNDDTLPLHVACQHHDSPRVVDYLIGLDSDTLTAVDGEGNSALHHACRGSKYETIGLLLEEHDAVAVSKRNAHKKLPIHLLFESNAGTDREEDTKYAESIFQLLRAYPETVMIPDTQKCNQSNRRLLFTKNSLQNA